MDGTVEKRELRNRILALRNTLEPGVIAAKSAEVVRRITGLPAFRDARTLMVFLNFGSEVVTDDLLGRGWAEGKRIVVPLCRPEGRVLVPCRIDGFDELAAGSYGIREPRADRLRVVDAGEIDAVVVPAVAFDRFGYRVGYGGGYYDRFLPQAPRAARIGAAFACQIVERVPVDRHDTRVALIVTEEGVITPEAEPPGGAGA